MRRSTATAREPGGRLPSRARAGLVAFLALALVATACSSGGGTAATSAPPATTPTPATSTPTSTPTTAATVTTAGPATPSTEPSGAAASALPRSPREKLIDTIVTGGVTAPVALTLFGLDVRPLPGAPSPPAPDEGAPEDHPISGTYATSTLFGVWDELTATQRTAALDATGIRAGAQPVGGPGRSIARPSAHRPLPRATTPDASFFLPYAKAADTAIAAKVGQPAIGAFDLVVDDDPNPSAYADTTYFDTSLVKLLGPDYGSLADACHIVVYFGNAGWTGASTDVILSILTHEVFHCYQQRAVGSAQAAKTVKPWLVDGEATWVMMELVPDAVFGALQAHWTRYISTPRHRPLFSRAYDGVGFFGRVEDAAGPEQVWPALLPAFVAGSGSDVAAFSIATAGDEQVILDHWASSYFRAHPSFAGFDMLGPSKGNMPPFGAAPETLTVSKDEVKQLEPIDPYENGITRISSSEDILTIVNGRGNMAIADSAEQLTDLVEPGASINLCLRTGGCVCPPGTEGDPPSTVPASAPIDVGLTGGRKGAFGYAMARSLDDFCTEPPPEGPPPPRRPPSGGGGGFDPGPDEGRSQADPHLVTFDGRRYDFHAVGEFTLVQSTVDDFTVQVRQAGSGSQDWWSANVAVATKIGSDRLVVTQDPTSDDVLHLERNGLEVNDPTVRLNGGSAASVRATSGKGWRLEWEDGTRVLALPSGGFGIDVRVAPSAARAGKLTGLLGDADGVSTDDPVVRGGAVLPDRPTHDELYATFGESWRITDAASLFDYAAGQNSATFTNRDLPVRTTPAIEAKLKDAEDRCRALGVSGDDLTACAFDVASTGDPALAFGYADGARREAYAPGATAKSRLIATFAGEVRTAGDQPRHTFTGARGDVVFVGGPSPDPCTDDKGLATDLTGPDGVSLGFSGSPCSMGRIDLPSDGTYTITLNALKERPGTYRFPVTLVRPDRIAPAELGDVLHGTIGFRGEHDVYRIAVTAGDVVSTTPPADQPDACVDSGTRIVVNDPDGNLETVAAGCALSAVTLQHTGTYTFVVNGQDTGVGPYRITLQGG